MENYTLLEDLEKLMMPILETYSAELVELTLSRTAGAVHLRLLTDKKEGGITVGECGELNRKIVELIDTAGIIKDNYTLEVSSPGLDRPLRAKGDFMRCLNKNAVFFLKEPIQGKLELKGKIIEAGDDTVKVAVGDTHVSIPLAAIGKAKQVF